MPQLVLAGAILMATTIGAQQPGAPALIGATESTLNGIAEVKGQVTIQVKGAPASKRFVLRHPADARALERIAGHRCARRVRRQQLRSHGQGHRHR